MLTFGMICLLLMGIGAGGYFIYKRTWKKAVAIAGILFFSLVSLIFLKPEKAQLNFEQTSFETNQDGLASIAGKTNKAATLEIAGQNIVIDDEGKFSYDVQLTDDSSQTLTVSAKFKNDELTERVTVNASSSFKKKLALAAKKAEEDRLAKLAAEKAARELAAAEAALTLAREKLTDENYQQAEKLVTSLSSPNQKLTTQLNDLKTQLALEKEQAKKLALAEKALDSAEQSPTKETYQAAKSLVETIPEKKQGNLVKRLALVDQTIATNEAAQKAEAQATAQAAAQAAEKQEVNTPAVGQVVLVTPTGKRYHNHVCGRGSYTEASLDEALARGLTPCQKCY